MGREGNKRIIKGFKGYRREDKEDYDRRFRGW